jgi:hypothetical protein
MHKEQFRRMDSSRLEIKAFLAQCGGNYDQQTSVSAMIQTD